MKICWVSPQDISPKWSLSGSKIAKFPRQQQYNLRETAIIAEESRWFFFSALRTYYSPLALDTSEIRSIRSSLTTKPKSQCRGLCSRRRRLDLKDWFKRGFEETQSRRGTQTSKNWSIKLIKKHQRRWKTMKDGKDLHSQCLNQIRRPSPQQKTRLLAPLEKRLLPMKMVHRATPKFVQIGPNNLYIYTQLYTDMIIYVYIIICVYIYMYIYIWYQTNHLFGWIALPDFH
jgi:hypothetical protein